MDAYVYLRALAALLLVLGLIGVIALLTKWLGKRYHFLPGTHSPKRRLVVQESLMIDSKRRLLLIKRDETEHLILTHPSGDIVIEHHIPSAKPSSDTPLST